ncbi:wax ester/triacylglycerol synthase domain-containing protein [Mycolicibacterium arseniciresistens]|uniref:Wax ester/triacylglycerol synthase family O-acyltransferase n=1 Tax=Mycolicibacterium arseniciresistens TaxID=3062257 RepID=A0ABT8U9K8_9MYCO|nr:wax ester/triacylglycerol synthase domain-containing protein [Mycolicibacterium arseniciresistens]MDO3634478.1 wax ester/triacylglycerol synthase family O-acyltransferase [Mycolicibacterium arseniciresistens]
MNLRLGPADAMALHTQTPTTPAHTVSLVILAGANGLSHDVLCRQLAAAVPRLARFRSRLVDKPFGMGQPVWAEIEHFDAARHIHRATVPAPGGVQELAELTTALSGGPQHSRRPLWEAWTIDGLAGGRWAVAVRLSPVLAEGGPGVSAFWDTVLTGTLNAENFSGELGLGSAPTTGALVADMLSEMVENQITGAWMAADAVAGALNSARERLQEAHVNVLLGPAVASMRGPVPTTVFNAPLTQRRSIAFATALRTDVELVSAAFGGSAANVLLAACTLSLRAWLQRHGVVPEEPLVITVAEGQVRVPVQLDDPVQVLTNMHTATERANLADSSDSTAGGDDDFAKVVSMLWPWAAQAGARVYSGLGLAQRGAATCHGSISFLGGGSETLFCAGAEVVGMYTAEPLVEGCGLNITVTSHADTMDVCVSACPDNVADVDDIARGVAEAVDVLVASAHRSPRGRGLSVVTQMASHSSRRG